MFTTQNFTRTFDVNNTEQMYEYDEILNDPMCTIIREVKEKLVDKEFDEGKLASVSERLVMVVTWQEKKLL